MTENQPNMEPNTMSGPMTAFIEDAYQDTLSLMTELRDFLAEVQAAPEDPNADRPPDVRARIVKEISSITRNLTEAMAWLLLQKAAGAGEITPEEAETGLTDYWHRWMRIESRQLTARNCRWKSAGIWIAAAGYTIRCSVFVKWCQNRRADGSCRAPKISQT